MEAKEKKFNGTVLSTSKEKGTVVYKCAKCGEIVETASINPHLKATCGCKFSFNRQLEGLTIEDVIFLSLVRQGQYYLCQKKGDGYYFMMKVRSHECSVYAAKYKYKKFVGQKFNMMTIVEIIDANNVRCKCECGTEKIYSLVHLLSDEELRPLDRLPYSCGCVPRTEIKRKARINAMIGKKYGHLTVVKDMGKGKYSQTMVECVCDCGKHVVVLEKNLKHGSPVENKSCGCVRDEMVRQTSLKRGRAMRKEYAETEVGKKYGRMTILAVLDRNEEYKSTHVIAKCDCGTIKTCALIELRQGKLKSCGCLSGQKMK